MSLTDKGCKGAKPDIKLYKLSDGFGLYLQVMPNTSKYWRFQYRFGGKQKSLALGSYPVVSLLEARNKREEARKQLAAGTDPGFLKKEKRRIDECEHLGLGLILFEGPGN